MSIIKEKSNLSNWIYIVLNPIILSVIPFLILWAKFGFSNFYYLLPIIGFIIGLFWAERVRKRGALKDYDGGVLLKTPDLIETWEKEKMRKEKNDEVNEIE